MAPQDNRENKTLKFIVNALQKGRFKEAEQRLATTENKQGQRLWLWVMALNGQGRFAESLELMEPVFSKENPDQLGFKLRGQTLYGLGRFAEAATFFVTALQKNPSDPEGYEHLATTLLALHLWDKALMTVDQGLRLNLGHRGLLRLRSVILWRMGEKETALALAENHVRQFPEDGPFWHERGVFLLEKGDNGRALADLERACTLMPGNVRAFNNRATALWRLGRYPEALESLERAVTLDPNDASAHHHRALLLLFLGDYTSGWKAYEWRWQDPAHLARKPPLAEPPWRGDVRKEATLMIYPEQGYGDTIQFIRFVSQAKKRVAQVIFHCSGPLAPLLQHAPGVDFLWQGEPPQPRFDLHAPLLSLPGLLQQNRDDFPGTMGYLPEFAWEKRQENRTPPDNLHVGFVWRGRPTHGNDHNRSVTLAWFEQLFGLDGLTWVCLQEGAGKKDCANSPWQDRLSCPELPDFAATARVMQTLDLVISVDTAVAHLAGAMGCPVWVLLPFVPDWRWGAEGETTPWYQSMRLFRQQRPGDWQGVKDRLIQEIKTLRLK